MLDGPPDTPVLDKQHFLCRAEREGEMTRATAGFWRDRPRKGPESDPQDRSAGSPCPRATGMGTSIRHPHAADHLNEAGVLSAQ